MARLTVDIRIANAATVLDDDPARPDPHALARLLRKAADYVEAGYTYRGLLDDNGQSVGSVAIRD